jgi:hypothetical protein
VTRDLVPLVDVPLTYPSGCPRCGHGRKICRCRPAQLVYLDAVLRELVDHVLICRCCDLEHRCVEGEWLTRRVHDARP